jgi:glutaredoxin 3
VRYTNLETVTSEFTIVVKVEIYISSLCGYCSRAKNLLDKKGVNFIEYDVTFDAGKRQEMVARAGKTAVPQVFIDDKPVGGFSDLIELDVDDELDNMLGIGIELSQ